MINRENIISGKIHDVIVINATIVVSIAGDGLSC